MRGEHRAAWALALGLGSAVVLAACGGAAPCRGPSDCPAGQICLAATSDGSGTCEPAPFGIELLEPAPGTGVGAAGVAIAARIHLASADARQPARVGVFLDGRERTHLDLAARDGATLTYRGAWRPYDDDPAQMTLWVAAIDGQAVVPSDAVLLAVDGNAPRLSWVNALCTGPCVRDGELQVWAEVDEEQLELVEATISLDGHVRTVPLEATGDVRSYLARVPLAGYRFPAFSGMVTARVRARDAIGNETVVDTPPVPVSRVRWVADLRDPPTAPLQVTSPAIDVTGSIVTVGTDGRIHVLSPDGHVERDVAIGGVALHAAPSLGAGSIWIGSDDGNLYRVAGGGTPLACPGNAAPGAMFTPAVALDPEEAFAGGAAARLYGAAADPGGCFPAQPVSTGDAVTAAAVIASGLIFVPVANAVGVARVETFSIDLVPGTTVTTLGSCTRIQAPLAVAPGAVVMACGNGDIYTVATATLASFRVATLGGAAVASPVVFPGGDLLVGTNDGKLHRLAPPPGGTGTWVDAWSPPPDLGAPITGVALAAADPDGVVAYAVTAAGALHALDAAGATVWSSAQDASQPLGRFALSFPAIAPGVGAGLPTLYAGSAEGKLYAVVVDGALDPASPWPKSHHDLGNTGNAGVPLR